MKAGRQEGRDEIKERITSNCTTSVSQTWNFRFDVFETREVIK